MKNYGLFRIRQLTIKNLFRMVISVLLLALAACSPPQKPRVFWPVPPDQPKLELIGIYASQNDFDKTGFEIFREGITGVPRPERFVIPQDVASDGRGRMFVADSSLKNVRIFNFNTKKIKLLTPRAPFRYPTGVEYGPDGLLYVADPHASTVFVMNTDTGAVVRVIGDKGELDKPVRTAINPRLGRIFVSDSGLAQIVVFDMEGNRLYAIGHSNQKGAPPGYFNNNQGVAVADDDRVYVADMFNARVQVFDKDGNYLFHFGERGDRPWQLGMPRDLAFDRDQNLYVVDSQRGALVVFDKEGAYLTTIGADVRTVSVLGFSVPSGIGIDPTDRIFIVDAMLRRINVWQYLNDDYLAKHPVSEGDLKTLGSLLKNR